MTQHDDHIWLTVLGQAWAIRAIERGPEGTLLWLWRGYKPNLEYTTIRMPPSWDQNAYANLAASWLEPDPTPYGCTKWRQ